MVRRVFLAFLVFGVVACGGSPTEPPTEPEDVPGTYNLQTVNERSLPFLTFFDIFGFVDHHITAWSITLNQDMTCSESVEWRDTDFIGRIMEDTRTDVCTYTFNDGAITLTFPADGTILTGSKSGPRLTLTEEGLGVLIYGK